MPRVVLIIGMPDGDWEVPLSVIQADWETFQAKCDAELGPGEEHGATWSEFASDWDAVESYVRDGLSWESVKDRATLRPNTVPKPDYEYEWDTACFMVQRAPDVGATTGAK